MKTGAQGHGRTGAQWARAVLVLALAAVPGAARAQERTLAPVSAAPAAAAWRPVAVPTQRRSRGFLPQVLVGAVGSVAGMVGGIYLGRGVCEVTSPCAGDQAGEEQAFVGIIAGSVVGTAAGTALGAKFAGVAPESFGRRLLGATAGLLAGAVASQLVGGDVNYALPLATFSVTQALVTTLLAPRPPEGAAR